MRSRWAIIIVFLALVAGFGPARAASGPEVRPAILAGTWYPADPGQLRRSIQGYLAQARASLPTGARLIALIVPHAGHRFSGPVAAYGYQLLAKGSFDRVLIIAPSHRVNFRGVSVFKGQAYATPLGRVPIDQSLSDALRKQRGFGYAWPIHQREHAIEIQLPFLQVALGRFKLIAAVMGRPTLFWARLAAQGILQVMGRRRVLLVASTDLSHFYTEEKAHALDRVLIRHLKNLDVFGLARAFTARQCFACGAGPLMAVMIAGKKLGANRLKVLKYATSADTGGGRQSVVGYLAAALYHDPRVKAGPPRHSSHGGVYSAVERGHLKKIARGVVVARLTGRPAPRLRPRFKALARPRGVFVTINRRGRLRGCIGHIRADQPLYRAVADAALSAAFRDPRFKPITRQEMADLEFEISVLSPLRPVKNVREVVVGRDGLFIVRGARAGLLLPQVPIEFGWTREQFLTAVCRKAGLAATAWREPGTRLYTFTAEVF